MGKDLIIATHAVEKLNRFMEQMVKDQRMTIAERDQVRNVGEKPFVLEAEPVKSPSERLQEVTNQIMARTYRKPDEGKAVDKARKTLEVKKAALLELRPELASDLEAGLESRVTLPKPVMGTRLEKPWNAVHDYDNLMEFIEEKVKDGKLSKEDAKAAREPAQALLRQDGLDDAHLSDHDDKVTIVQAFCLAKKTLQDIRPEFAAELHYVGASVSKVMPRGLG